MSYEVEIQYNQYDIIMEYSLGKSYELVLDGWKLYNYDGEVIPSRDESVEIEEIIETWLHEEYLNHGTDYHETAQAAHLDKMWEDR